MLSVSHCVCYRCLELIHPLHPFPCIRMCIYTKHTGYLITLYRQPTTCIHPRHLIPMKHMVTHIPFTEIQPRHPHTCSHIHHSLGYSHSIQREQHRGPLGRTTIPARKLFNLNTFPPFTEECAAIRAHQHSLPYTTHGRWRRL